MIFKNWTLAAQNCLDGLIGVAIPSLTAPEELEKRKFGRFTKIVKKGQLLLPLFHLKCTKTKSKFFNQNATKNTKICTNLALVYGLEKGKQSR